MAHIPSLQLNITPDDVLSFWLDELTPKDWYVANDALDAKIRERFLPAWENAQEGAYSLWLTHASGALAYIILNDQMPRNMFRGEGKSFASDRIALAAAKAAISKGWDLKIDAPARQFFYMPLMHSECLTDQERNVCLFKERMSASDDNMRHAQAHRNIIREFGRFPYRNEALVRATNTAEEAFLANGGYRYALECLAPVAA
ncbi:MULTISPECIES: DUF924 family protein [Pacificibacter]|uniref:DUF924 family protein n=1 Tax=Pacificibacter TaxID=1042323 RepID=UPI001C0A342F|nr:MULTISPECIES: DUF924 family protein [Pacificibacter]MBU2935256.1 DUF924 domain-containing protein [Pacificibacter marinus]MDO6615410.1 DUF924 family protein [Pacificibacter sp. 1_MG-2023]